MDWQLSLAQAKRIVAGKAALQGNLDPAALLGDVAKTVRETKRVLDDYGDGPGHIFNLGHGVYKHTSPRNVAALIETVKEYSSQTAK